MKIRINLGTMVQNSSRGWDSNICWSMLIFVAVEIKL